MLSPPVVLPEVLELELLELLLELPELLLELPVELSYSL
jgi:hypothetical protein